ncbi:MAG: thrombospondin 2/3/4/5 [Thermoplasmata archaeon]|nr:thrombospondin 2/3/4/5 [Thermoplasmata archaeon]
MARSMPIPLMMAAAAAALLAAFAVVATPADAGVILDNGSVQLGVGDYGDLGVAGDVMSPGGTCRSSVSGGGCGTDVVALRDTLTQLEGVADYCVCEGWGLSYRPPGAATATVGWAQSGTAPGTAGVVPTAFVASATKALVEARVGDLRITHDFTTTSEPTVFQATVTIENVGSLRLGDIRYRRTVDFDAEPSPQNEVVTISPLAGFPIELRCMSFDPFVQADPTTPYGFLSPPSPGSACGGGGGTVGPGEYGAMLEIRSRRYTSPLSLSTLDPGEKARFKLFYGAASQPGALAPAFTNLGVQVQAIAFAQIPDATGTGSATTATPVGEFGFGYADYPCVDPDPACAPCVVPPAPLCPDPTTPPCGAATWPSGPCPPNASFTYSQVAPGCAMTPVDFSDGSTPGPAYVIVAWYWEFGDGTTSGASNPSHTYDAPGTYVVTLTVTAANGEVDVYVLTVNVIGPNECVSPSDPSGSSGGKKAPGDYYAPRDGCVATARDSDLDGDGKPDFCDEDVDGDGIHNTADNCPTKRNPGQADLDGDILGDECDGDLDGDGVDNAFDNCGYVRNPVQSNVDGDALGDVCDSDRDGDGILDHLDCFPDDPLKDCRHRDGVGYVMDDLKARDFNRVVAPDSQFLGLTLAGWALVFTSATLMLFMVLVLFRRRRDDEDDEQA